MTNDRDHTQLTDDAPEGRTTPSTLLELRRRWTPRQADAIFEFIAELQSAFFLAYEQPLIEIDRQEALLEALHDDDIDQDRDEEFIPF